MPEIVLETNLPTLKLRHRGKVRDIYELGETLLIVATDRISAFDVVLPNGIPYKGQVLTAISAFWFDFVSDLVEHHLISVDVSEFPPEAQPYADQLRGRTMYVHKANRVDIECVVRGYLSGSAWREYRQSGTVCGQRLPAGLRESERLPEPIFTPATKAETGHDENISVEEMARQVGWELTEKLRELSLAIYNKAAAYALERGIIIADTKFEFGLREGRVILIDELLTPDSSRFWPADEYQPGRPQRSFDKQYVRDYLESLDWNKQPPAPELPPEVVQGTSQRYREAYERLVGRPFPAQD
ncbi:MAG: phosphoribosylaminoimidazole-succinocarboxamide synthase [Candidatus Poribacteria bacterium]|nr:MAG: phosphoribosylaminoimidazole-succinocarboxamide synthase [Candidatus Poribacteria bacterium]